MCVKKQDSVILEISAHIYVFVDSMTKMTYIQDVNQILQGRLPDKAYSCRAFRMSFRKNILETKSVRDRKSLERASIIMGGDVIVV